MKIFWAPPLAFALVACMGLGRQERVDFAVTGVTLASPHHLKEDMGTGQETIQQYYLRPKAVSVGDLLRIDLITDKDVGALGRRLDLYYSGMQVSFCDDPDGWNILIFPLYDVNGADVTRWHKESTPGAYHTYLPLKWHKNGKFPGYDLTVKPRDMCIRLDNHNGYTGDVLSSNEIRIKAATISNLLK